jgi:hypothetical protein
MTKNRNADDAKPAATANAIGAQFIAEFLNLCYTSSSHRIKPKLNAARRGEREREKVKYLTSDLSLIGFGQAGGFFI